MGTIETTPRYWDEYYAVLEKKGKPPRIIELIKEIIPTPKSKFDARIHNMMLCHDTETLLDAGCGQGRFVLSCASKVNMCVGIDFSRDALHAAAKMRKTDTRAPDNTAFCLARIESLPFVDDCFDLILSLGVIEHFSNPVPLLKEMRRVLRPGGLLYVTVPNRESFGYTERWKERLRAKFGYHDFYTPGELASLIESMKLEVKKAYSPDFAAGVVNWWYDYIAVTYLPNIRALKYLYAVVTLPLYWSSSLLNPLMKHKGPYIIVEATKA